MAPHLIAGRGTRTRIFGPKTCDSSKGSISCFLVDIFWQIGARILPICCPWKPPWHYHSLWQFWYYIYQLCPGQIYAVSFEELATRFPSRTQPDFGRQWPEQGQGSIFSRIFPQFVQYCALHLFLQNRWGMSICRGVGLTKAGLCKTGARWVFFLLKIIHRRAADTLNFRAKTWYQARI